MIHIFHGEHHEHSRKELTSLKQRLKLSEVIIFEGRTVTPTELIQATQSTSLFGSERLVVIENFLSKRLTRKTTEAKELLNWIKDVSVATEIVFWEEKEIGKTILSLFPKETDLALFRPDKTIFTLVEMIKSANAKELIRQLGICLQNETAEFVFAMLARQFRLLIMVKDTKTATGVSPWQLSKLTKQSSYFTLTQLVTLYRELLDLDLCIKTGRSPFTLSAQLELFFIRL